MKHVRLWSATGHMETLQPSTQSHLSEKSAFHWFGFDWKPFLRSIAHSLWEPPRDLSWLLNRAWVIFSSQAVSTSTRRTDQGGNYVLVVWQPSPTHGKPRACAVTWGLQTPRCNIAHQTQSPWLNLHIKHACKPCDVELRILGGQGGALGRLHWSRLAKVKVSSGFVFPKASHIVLKMAALNTATFSLGPHMCVPLCSHPRVSPHVSNSSHTGSRQRNRTRTAKLNLLPESKPSHSQGHWHFGTWKFHFWWWISA